jgi:glycine/D-amino acid oxidase-like deaminating enzyme
MKVGVLGGGLQGCCVALALAERCDVVLFDRNPTLLSRTAVANEGKIHLGYMYAGDPTFATARMMMKGALAFAPFMRRYIGSATRWKQTSAPASYVVHRNSQHDVMTVTAYLNRVHRLIEDMAEGIPSSYFGLDLKSPPRPWSTKAREEAFNPEVAVAVFDTPEVAIRPDHLAQEVRACVTYHPRIEVRLGHFVSKAEYDRGAIRLTSEASDRAEIDRFDHVVNALWDGRLALDASIGLRPGRSWLYRNKYGISFKLPAGLEAPPTATVISGPFGEVVSHPDRSIYLTWYPECLHGISRDLTPPDWPSYPAEPLRSQILQRTISALADIVPCLKPLEAATLSDVEVKGGVIFAWGATDICDPQSELHRRHEIGVHSFDNYHSIDPGKLTMAPYFADMCANRIFGSV